MESRQHTVYLGLGSNIQARQSLHAGLDRLENIFSIVGLSSVYFSEAVGFNGPPFLNMVVKVRTGLSLTQVVSSLHAIEVEFGRVCNNVANWSRRLDIDILLFDDLRGLFGRVQLPRPEIVENAYVLAPIAELIPELIHPDTDRTYSELWLLYDQNSQIVQKVDFEWHGERISCAASFI